MTDLDQESIKKLTRLCRIDCTQEEQDSLLIDLKKIIGYMNSLTEINTDDVEPCNHVLEEIVNVMREDIIGETLKRDAFLANAPSQIGGMLRVPSVIKQG